MKKRTQKFLAVLVGVIFIVLIGFQMFRPYSKVYVDRIQFGISDFFIRNWGLDTPEDIIRIDDLRYGEEEMQVMDIYYPRGTVQALPTIVSIHGGGFIYGDKEVYQYYCMSLAQRGFTVVNFSYWLAPEYRYPAPLVDTNEVMAYICNRASEYYIDTDNIFLVGDASGTQVNIQYTAAVTNPENAEMLNLQVPKFTLRAIALNCGVYKMDELSDDYIQSYLGDAFSPDDEELDVLSHITEDFPPAYIVSATGDSVLQCAEPMSDFLTEKGLANELHIYGDEKAKPPHVFHCNIKNEYATICNDEECEFLRKYVQK